MKSVPTCEVAAWARTVFGPILEGLLMRWSSLRESPAPAVPPTKHAAINAIKHSALNWVAGILEKLESGAGTDVSWWKWRCWALDWALCFASARALSCLSGGSWVLACSEKPVTKYNQPTPDLLSLHLITVLSRFSESGYCGSSSHTKLPSHIPAAAGPRYTPQPPQLTVPGPPHRHLLTVRQLLRYLLLFTT